MMKIGLTVLYIGVTENQMYNTIWYDLQELGKVVEDCLTVSN